MNVKITLKEDAVIFDAQGDVRMNVVLHDFVEYAIEEDQTFEVLFSLRYLHWMCSFSKLSDEIYLHFSRELPMKMEYFIENKNNYINLFLAPKMDDY